MDKCVISFSKNELLELQELLIDEDEAACLRFIKKTIAPKIPVKGSALCDSSRINPFLVKRSD